MTFEKKKTPLKLRKNKHYYKVLVAKYVKNTLLVADLGIFFHITTKLMY